jgi:cobalt/nickel transport system permease protein
VIATGFDYDGAQQSPEAFLSMHIPDGYLSPVISLAAGAVTVPVWGIASMRVKRILDNRTIPLLAVFSALCFTIMMFNVPVPGGTTAHGVGGAITAIILGPWAAVIAVSTALIIQALFFGDGGVLALFVNCLTMGIILPFTAYWTYKAIAGRSPVLSPRRAWAAGIGGYVGLTMAGLAVGILLGIQPSLFNENGRPLYSPYGLEAAVPAMLIVHLLGASIVEGLIAGLGVSFFQKRHPEYLESAGHAFTGGQVLEEGAASRRPLWQVVTASVIAAIAVLGVIGLAIGGGDPNRLFGADWSAVSWSEVGAMLVFVLVTGAILLPVAYLVLPRRYKRVGTAFTALAIVAPLGLIAPGFAYGEGSAEDVQQAFGYVPKGLQDLSSLFSAPLSGYDVPFLPGLGSPMVRAAMGYEITGILGILLCGAAVVGLASLLRRVGSPSEPAGQPTGQGG